MVRHGWRFNYKVEALWLDAVRALSDSYLVDKDAILYGSGQNKLIELDLLSHDEYCFISF